MLLFCILKGVLIYDLVLLYIKQYPAQDRLRVTVTFYILEL